MSYADKVRAGIALLDEQVSGWTERIDVDWLDLRYCDQCVLGQLFDDFSDGLDFLEIDPPAFGFDLEDLDWNYRVLTRLWTFVIRKRQGGDS